MAASDYKLYIRKATSIAHELYTDAADITDGNYVELRDPEENLVYLPITSDLLSFSASPLRVRGKDGTLYAAKQAFFPYEGEETFTHGKYLYNLSGSVTGKYYYLGELPFVAENIDKPLLVTLRFTGYTVTGGGWYDSVYTQIGIHIDGTPHIILPYASYGRSDKITYDNELIADRMSFTLDEAGYHTIGFCVWARCTKKDRNSCYVDSFYLKVEQA